MHLQTLFNTISLAVLAVIGSTLAQDDGPGYVTKCAQPGQVALTFDDGPSQFTTELLGYLSTANVTATFFVLGVSINQDGGKDTLKAAYNAGHQIALHSNTHADMNTKTADEILSEYSINLKAVQDTIGVSPAMARPPFGNCNANCAKVLEGQMNLTVIQWNCDSNDWRFEGKVAEQPKLFTNMETIIDKSNPSTDSFVTLQHDIDDFSVKYVPKVIDMIKTKGYSFVTVEQCANKPGYVGKSVSAPVQSPASSPAADASVPSSPAADASVPSSPTADASVPSTTPVSAAAAVASSPAVSSADKITFTLGLYLIGLIFGLLAY